MIGTIEREDVRSSYKLKINLTGVSHVLKYHKIINSNLYIVLYKNVQ